MVLPNTLISQPVLENDSIPIEVEYFILQNLFANPAFGRFYELNRQRITAPLYWLPDEKLVGTGVYFCDHYLRLDFPECYVIHFPQMPPRHEEAFYIAHEMSHILLDLEGYPGVVGQGQSIATAATLSSLFTDQVINRRLSEQYGFELPIDGQRQLQRSINTIGGKTLPTHPLLYAEWLFEQVYFVFTYEIAKGSGAIHPIYEWSQKQYPKLTCEVDKLLPILRKTGWETPKQQERLLNYLIGRYGLKRFGLRVTTAKYTAKMRARCLPPQTAKKK